MLTVSRSVIRQFHKILRPAGIVKRSRANILTGIRLIADPDGLTLSAVDNQFSVSLHHSGSYESETFVVPVPCLTDCCERIEGDVTFRQVNDRVITAWTDRDLPIEKEYDAINLDKPPSIPPVPDHWSENPSKLFDALRNAMRTTDSTSGRYVLDCVQLDGASGQITGTDTRQLLVQRGFIFPWTDNVLIPASRIFEPAVLPAEELVQVGRTATHVHFRIGPWQIAFAIRTDGRFPDVQRVLSDAPTLETTLSLETCDAQFLVQHLEQLPVDDEIHRPVTVDLNGSVAVRARQSPDSVPTELVLSRSQRIGNEARFATDRNYLGRAVDLGFSEIGITPKKDKAICRDEQREFVWALLEDAAVPPSDQTRRVASCSEGHTNGHAVPVVSGTSLANTSITAERRSRPKSRPRPATQVSNVLSPRKQSMSRNPDAIPTEADLINQLLDLRTQLRTIEQSIVTIARHLRGRQKQRQLMKATLASLRQLQTLNV